MLIVLEVCKQRQGVSFLVWGTQGLGVSLSATPPPAGLTHGPSAASSSSLLLACSFHLAAVPGIEEAATGKTDVVSVPMELTVASRRRVGSDSRGWPEREGTELCKAVTVWGGVVRGTNTTAPRKGCYTCDAEGEQELDAEGCWRQAAAGAKALGWWV